MAPGGRPGRLRFLAQVARRSTNQGLERRAEHKAPILLAFVAQAAVDQLDSGATEIMPAMNRTEGHTNPIHHTPVDANKVACDHESLARAPNRPLLSGPGEADRVNLANRAWRAAPGWTRPFGWREDVARMSQKRERESRSTQEDDSRESESRGSKRESAEETSASAKEFIDDIDELLVDVHETLKKALDTDEDNIDELAEKFMKDYIQKGGQ